MVKFRPCLWQHVQFGQHESRQAAIASPTAVWPAVAFNPQGHWSPAFTKPQKIKMQGRLQSRSIASNRWKTKYTSCWTDFRLGWSFQKDYGGYEEIAFHVFLPCHGENEKQIHGKMSFVKARTSSAQNKVGTYLLEVLKKEQEIPEKFKSNTICWINDTLRIKP